MNRFVRMYVSMNVYVCILYKYFFKGRLCSYVNLEFLQFYFVSAKIYILQIYLYTYKTFLVKNTNTTLKASTF